MGQDSRHKRVMKTAFLINPLRDISNVVLLTPRSKKLLFDIDTVPVVDGAKRGSCSLESWIRMLRLRTVLVQRRAVPSAKDRAVSGRSSLRQPSRLEKKEDCCASSLLTSLVVVESWI